MTKRPNDIAELLRNLKDSDVEVVSFDGYHRVVKDFAGEGTAVVTLGEPDPPKQHKYRAQRTEVDGIKFDSKAEAERYVTLKEAERLMLLDQLELQPTFVLVDGFTDSFGKRHRAITYKADFSYRVGTKRIVEDVKGVQTPLFRLKHKLLMFRYCVGSNPQFEFRIVDKKGREK